MILIPLFAGLSGQEVVIILFLVLFLFGGKKIPELMKGIGKGVRNFKQEMNGVKETIHSTQKTISEKPVKSDSPASSN